MIKILSTLLMLFCISSVSAQVKRAFIYKDSTVPVLAQNNRMENSFGFPGLRAFIVIGSASPDSLYNADELRRIPVAGIQDYACFYYLRNNFLSGDTSAKEFLARFIDWCYQTDYINRNRVTLVLNDTTGSFSCDLLNGLDTIISSIHLSGGGRQTGCGKYAVSSASEIWQHSRNARTAIDYHVPGLPEMETLERARRQRRVSEEDSKKKGHIFFQLTVGKQTIGGQYRTDFDTATMVDFARYRTLWNIRAGYYFLQRLSGWIDFAFIYSGKQKALDGIDWDNGNGGITVQGSGYAAAMIRYGLGAGWLLYHKGSLDVLLGLSAGRLMAIAGGGNATRTIGGGAGGTTEIIRRNEQTAYYNLSPAINYKLSRTLFFTGNLQYNVSKLRNPVGSVTAFTGWSFNAGIGFYISPKKDHE